MAVFVIIVHVCFYPATMCCIIFIVHCVSFDLLCMHSFFFWSYSFLRCLLFIVCTFFLSYNFECLLFYLLHIHTFYLTNFCVCPFVHIFGAVNLCVSIFTFLYIFFFVHDSMIFCYVYGLVNDSIFE